MKTCTALTLLFATAFAIPGYAQETPPVGSCIDGNGPKSAVMAYLSAMHKQRFDDAFDYVTKTMTDGLTRADWSALQARAYQPSKIEIYGVDVRSAMATAADPDCTKRAIVPNILSSRDKLNEHGSVEFEIYVVVLDHGQWRIDEQQSLFEDNEISRWFPTVKAIKADSGA